MEFCEVLLKRHCVRKFDSRKNITDDQINKLLKNASLSPSEGNIQPWFFIVVKKQELKEKLTETIFGNINIEKASVIFITCINQIDTYSKYGYRGLNLYSIQSTAAATEHLFLEAAELGLDACWIGNFDENKVKEILDLNENLRPVAIMPVGYSAEKTFKTSRKNIKEISKIIE